MRRLFRWGARGDMRLAGGCKRWVSWANYARHVRSCGREYVGGGGLLGSGGMLGLGLRRGQVKIVTSGGCGREMRAGQPG